MAAIGFRFNFSYQDKILANLMWDVRFRQALSVAINRSEINQLVFLGLGAPQQMTIKGASFYREGWDQYYAQYDPALAKKLLGEMGLKTSSDGFFLRPDGKPLELTLIVSTEALVGPIGQKIAELTAQYWEEIGVRTIVRPQETSLYYALMNNGDLSIFVWPSESDIEVRTVADVWSFSVNPKSPLGYAPEWGKWFVHDSWEKEGRFGAEPPKGEEPPEELKQHYSNYIKYTAAKNDQEYEEYAHLFWDKHTELLATIGTVGNPPAPVMITNRLKNVPPSLPFSAESFLWVTAKPIQWYFSDIQ